jgi:hypothetical protein
MRFRLDLRIVVAPCISVWQFARTEVQMKNTKHPSGTHGNQSTQQRRASALRALRDSALKSVKGGAGTDPPPPSSDPIC